MASAARCADDGQRGGIAIGIGGQNHADDLRFVQRSLPGNRGRIGRSIRRLVRISFSDRTSFALDKAAGNLPAE